MVITTLTSTPAEESQWSCIRLSRTAEGRTQDSGAPLGVYAVRTSDQVVVHVLTPLGALVALLTLLLTVLARLCGVLVTTAPLRGLLPAGGLTGRVDGPLLLAHEFTPGEGGLVFLSVARAITQRISNDCAA